MEKQPLVSILVPIYNVEKYLTECLNSIINQTLKNIEIICINDGSTDNSLNIIKSFIKNDSRIKVINKPNSGYGDSMNQGLSQACGKYVGIIESDDIADYKMFELLYKKAKKHDFPDIIKTNYYKYWSKKKETLYCKNSPKKLYNKLFIPIENKKIFTSTPAIWSAIYKNNFLKKNKITFNPTEGASYQDTSFNFKVLALAKSMICLKDALLYYRQDNENSSVNNPAKIYCVCDEFKNIEDFLNKNPKISENIYSFKNVLKMHTYLWNYNRLSIKYKDEFLNIFREEFLKEKKDTLIKKEFSSQNWKLLKSLLKNKISFKEELLNQMNSYLKPYEKELQKKIAKIDNPKLILYGFSPLAKVIYEKNLVHYIIDRNDKLTTYKNTPITKFDDFNDFNNEIFVITSINKEFISQIKQTIRKKYKKARVISL